MTINTYSQKSDSAGSQEKDLNEVNFGALTGNGTNFVWRPDASSNDSIVIAGGSGDGKSNFVKSFILQRILGSDKASVHIFDMHNDYKPVAQHAAELLGRDTCLLCEPTQSGLPFRLLENTGGLPARFRADNILTDFISAGARLGSNQKAAFRRALKRGVQESWENQVFFRHLENMDEAPNLENQIAQSLALLDFPEIRLSDLLAHQMVRHDLSKIHDRTSRAAYAISLLSQVMQHRHESKGNREKSEDVPLIFIFEEAELLNGATPQMRRFFNESRKLRCSGIFVSQLWNDIPSFVKDNCATQILFGSALKGKREAHLRKFEALVRGEDAEQSLNIKKVVQTIDYRTLVQQENPADSSFIERTPSDHLKQLDTSLGRHRDQTIEVVEHRDIGSKAPRDLYLKPQIDIDDIDGLSLQLKSYKQIPWIKSQHWLPVVARFSDNSLSKAFLYHEQSGAAVISDDPFEISSTNSLFHLTDQRDSPSRHKRESPVVFQFNPESELSNTPPEFWPDYKIESDRGSVLYNQSSFRRLLLPVICLSNGASSEAPIVYSAWKKVSRFPGKSLRALPSEISAQFSLSDQSIGEKPLDDSPTFCSSQPLQTKVRC